MPSPSSCSLRSLLLLVPLLLPACKGDDPPPASDETGSTGGSTAGDPSATSGMTTAPPPTTTGVDPDSTTFGPGCGPDPCAEQCGPECEPTATCIASVWMCECECPTTDTGDTCSSLDVELDAWVDPSKTPALDCGSLDPTNDATEWQTAHDCILNQLMGSGLRATWSLDAGSDPYQYGVGARLVAMTYEISWFEASSTSTLVQYSCDAIVPTPDCVVDVGQMCLTCEGQTELAILCEDPR
ncbi:hypothetical protein [Paraliomyxa miuraensis]|uniref:hypothetical protein n=1 Tax=Paraliomyxa miuraensis TaxID=376150 RepID=UPI00224D4B4A|nr:hypothetical protein [Paraliomyxa miuraensis]MCX4242162.1 hypothetical protein [Paraliomyxa miuraensis]